ncbi:hypothetical protein AAG570_013787 [Ranatra chinensis]|uniref:CBM21 domain-containing protein n=1 Tax=Ranatra chinensis TaxID=642074 RepID=A0ABD0YD72_9HEMI
MSREKKIVRFADALGLDLADIRTFLDEPPKIPKSAFQDLEGVELSGAAALPERAVVPLFRQPIQQSDFMERLNYCKVCLECASVTDINLFTVTGTVRVVNLAFHKAVWIRYTRDNWKTFVDLPAKYVDNSCDGFSDKFRFVLFAHTLNVGDRLEFAVRFEAGQGVYWDNNRSANYAFQCVPEAPPKPVVSAYLPSSVRLETWGSFY